MDKPDPIDPTAKEEYNPYRFNSKRWDNSTGMYDMGFRDYNPNLNRFLNLDSYNGALDDLSLSLDPWTANRYAFTGGNPITGIEHDGHEPRPWHNPKYKASDCQNNSSIECSPGSEGKWFAANQADVRYREGMDEDKDGFVDDREAARNGLALDHDGSLNGAPTKAALALKDFLLGLQSTPCGDIEDHRLALACLNLYALTGGIEFGGPARNATRGIFEVRAPNKLHPPRADVTEAMLRACHPNMDCDEIAEDLLETAGGVGKLIRYEPAKGTMLRTPEAGGRSIEDYVFHVIYTDGKYAYDPRFSSTPVPLGDYHRMMSRLNPGIIKK
ncbi:RHS repeat-associated core domain-containing protein [Nonomuraea sp. NPDC048916]|uniref:RHS repeat-associated core domain-containing protein n=1 Tax=Nonomuraea sp. NPDC048916 TaxID=3154232 RepID=UPI0033EFAED7